MEDMKEFRCLGSTICINGEIYIEASPQVQEEGKDDRKFGLHVEKKIPAIAAKVLILESGCFKSIRMF